MIPVDQVELPARTFAQCRSHGWWLFKVGGVFWCAQYQNADANKAYRVQRYSTVARELPAAAAITFAHLIRAHAERDAEEAKREAAPLPPVPLKSAWPLDAEGQVYGAADPSCPTCRGRGWVRESALQERKCLCRVRT